MIIQIDVKTGRSDPQPFCVPALLATYASAASCQFPSSVTQSRIAFFLTTHQMLSPNPQREQKRASQKASQSTRNFGVYLYIILLTTFAFRV